MSKNLDINSINNKIIKNLEKKYSNIDRYKKQLEQLQLIIKNDKETDKRIIHSIEQNIEMH